MSIRILADQYLYKLDQVIPEGHDIVRFDPENGLPANVPEFDALLIRTVNKINEETLPEPGRLSFVGTATAGFDHIDTGYLRKIGVKFGHSPGCNARAVAEYVLTCLFRWSQKSGVNLKSQRIGVVGCGHTGSALIHLLESFDLSFATYDPPRAKRDLSFISASVTDLLSCDILTFHTPLTEHGIHATRHLCSEEWLSHSFKLIINAARGGVVDETSLLNAIHHGVVRDCILDVWENEPVFSDRLAGAAYIATPHIAGYSREAKIRASQMVAEAMCKSFGLEMQVQQFSMPVNPETLKQPETGSLSDFLWSINQIDLYDRELRKLTGLPAREKAGKFSLLRTATPTRFEYRTIIEALEEAESFNLPEGVELFLKS